MSAEAERLRLGVVGAGTMGSGIALAALHAGLEVTLFDVQPGALSSAHAYLQKHLERKDNLGALEQARFTQDLGDLAGSDVVVEAATEDLALKQDLFRRLDEICPSPAILATNTSTLPVTALAAATASPERVAGMHFFNPAAVMRLVEIVHGARTAPSVLNRLVSLAQRMQKTSVVTQDRPGFIVNRVARPFYGEALRILGEGTAGVEEIDAILEGSAGFRMGPFRLMDLIGIDVNTAAMRSMFEQTNGEPRYRPHWIQEQMVRQNALGRKTGRGFYTYAEGEPEPPEPQAEAARRSGLMLVTEGTWAPGLGELLLRGGYTLSEAHGGPPTAGWAPAGRSEDLQASLARLDAHLPASAPLFCQAADATVAEAAGWVAHPERLVGFDGLFIAAGTHAALAPGPVTSAPILEQAEGIVRDLGRLPVWIEDGPALIAPRVVAMLANEAAFAAGEGVAEADTIDLAMELGVNYPRGPLAWARELGWSRVLAVLDHLRTEFGEERYRAAPWLRRRARLEALEGG